MEILSSYPTQNYTLLGYCVASSGNFYRRFGTNYRSILRVLDRSHLHWFKILEPWGWDRCCTETSRKNYYSLRNNQQGGSSDLLRGGSSKSRFVPQCLRPLEEQSVSAVEGNGGRLFKCHVQIMNKMWELKVGFRVYGAKAGHTRHKALNSEFTI
jgi:hypothetical protein